MGHGIASNLLRAGYTTRVYNRTKEKAKDLVEQGAILVNQPSDVIESAGIVFTMLSDDSALREIAEVDENFVKKLHPGGIHVSLSTVSPDTARSLSAHHSQNGVTYLAAPVIGRPDRAAAGTLFILLAGSVEAKQIVSPFLEKISQRVFDFGDLPWSSNMAKLAFNFNIAAANRGYGGVIHSRRKKRNSSRQDGGAAVGDAFLRRSVQGIRRSHCPSLLPASGNPVSVGMEGYQVGITNRGLQLDSHADRIVIARSSAVSNIKGSR